jgi:flagellar L-ring protein FlgH
MKLLGARLRENLEPLLLGILVVILAMGLTGCSSFGKKMKSFLNGGEEPAPTQQKRAGLKFSDAPNVNPKVGEKQYRRVTKEIFEKEGVLEENSGSLWVMEGQGSYLFSQNLMRISGDVLNISLDGVPQSSLSKKVEIIKTLLERSRKVPRYPAASADLAQANPQAAQNAPPPADGQQQQQGQPGQANPQVAAVQAAQNADEKADADDEKKAQFDVSSIPSRIVEKTQDGSYRIKGSQSFMIGRKEYRVIATGVVRPADIKNDTIAASQMVDSKFDVIAIKKEPK